MANKKKLKILMLGSDDNRLQGHVYSAFERMPDSYDKRLVIFDSHYHDTQRSFVDSTTFWGKVKRKFYRKWQSVRKIWSTGVFAKIDLNKQEYCFYGNEFTSITARSILKKCKGFVPDIISIHWVAGFISSKVIKDLHCLTDAKIVFVFVDEAHMTGGCHYPVDCKGYLDGCYNCPALGKGKELAAIQMCCKQENLKDILKFIIGSPYDCRLAVASPLFKDSKAFSGITIPKMPSVDCLEARRMFGISDTEFVIMIGANSLTDVRKGIIYSMQSIKKFASCHYDICVLALGKRENVDALDVGNARIITPGFVDFDKLCVAFAASDCFLSTTVADSGPMMVNFSIAMNTPVVSFDIGIAQDLVLHKKTGYIARYKDVDDVANGIEFLYNSGKDSMKKECDTLITNLCKTMVPPFEALYDYMINI